MTIYSGWDTGSCWESSIKRETTSELTDWWVCYTEGETRGKGWGDWESADTYYNSAGIVDCGGCLCAHCKKCSDDYILRMRKLLMIKWPGPKNQRLQRWLKASSHSSRDVVHCKPSWRQCRGGSNLWRWVALAANSQWGKESNTENDEWGRREKRRMREWESLYCPYRWIKNKEKGRERIRRRFRSCNKKHAGPNSPWTLKGRRSRRGMGESVLPIQVDQEQGEG